MLRGTRCPYTWVLAALWEVLVVWLCNGEQSCVASCVGVRLGCWAALEVQGHCVALCSYVGAGMRAPVVRPYFVCAVT